MGLLSRIIYRPNPNSPRWFILKLLLWVLGAVASYYGYYVVDFLQHRLFGQAPEQTIAQLLQLIARYL